jgi:hypothetical protein
MMQQLIKVSEIFDIKYGVNLELINLEQCKSSDANAIAFVSRSEKNNGVSAFVEKLLDVEPNSAHTLSVAGSGSVLATFYQPFPYYSGRDLYILIPRIDLSPIEMLFYAKCIASNKYKYNYGRQANKTLKDILIPSKMPQDLKQKLANFANSKLRQTSSKPFLDKKIDLSVQEWKEFKLEILFKISGSKTTPLLDLEEFGAGKFPYITTQATNNGVEGFYDFYSEEGNVLTVDSAVLGFCAYQQFNFSASDHVEKLTPKFSMNKYVAMFLTTILNLEKYRYNYGRKCSQTRMKEISIKLPSKNNAPDFDFMEKFIKSLPYSSSI